MLRQGLAAILAAGVLTTATFNKAHGSIPEEHIPSIEEIAKTDIDISRERVNDTVGKVQGITHHDIDEILAKIVVKQIRRMFIVRMVNDENDDSNYSDSLVFTNPKPEANELNEIYGEIKNIRPTNNADISYDTLMDSYMHCLQTIGNAINQISSRRIFLDDIETISLRAYLHEKAIDVYTKLLYTELRNTGEHNTDTGRVKEMIEQSKHTRDNYLALARLSLAKMNMERGNYEKALELSDGTVDHAPQQELANFLYVRAMLRSDLYLRLGKPDKALEEIQEALTTPMLSKNAKGDLGRASSYIQESYPQIFEDFFCSHPSYITFAAHNITNAPVDTMQSACPTKP